MSEDNINLEDNEMQQLAMLVAKALNDGDSPQEVVAELVNNGMEQNEAEELVAIVEMQLYQAQHPTHHQGGGGGGGEGMGWIIWIGLIIGFNVLSQIFNWGWVLY